MKTPIAIEQFIANGRIENELDLERALVADRQLKHLAKSDPHYKQLRHQLRELIAAYEKAQWSDADAIDERRMEESDVAELIAEMERAFLQKRKQLIKAQLAQYGLTQQELGALLGHKSKTYMSELMNGLSPFSLKDLVLLHRLFRIPMDQLVPVFLSKTEQERVRNVLATFGKPGLKLHKKDLTLV